MRYFYQNICYVKLMDCGCRLFHLTQNAPREDNLHYTPWLCTKPKATYKRLLTFFKTIYNQFTNSTYLQNINKVFTRYLPTYYLQNSVCKNLVWILKFRPLWIWFSSIFKMVTIFVASSCFEIIVLIMSKIPQYWCNMGTAAYRSYTCFSSVVPWINGIPSVSIIFNPEIVRSRRSVSRLNFNT